MRSTAVATVYRTLNVEEENHGDSECIQLQQQVKFSNKFRRIHIRRSQFLPGKVKVKEAEK
jgi:hypothetical protein